MGWQMRTRKQLSGVALVTTLTFAMAAGSGPAGATEGYFQHGYGVVSKALAGSGVAYSQDAMASALNPAGLVQVDDQVNVGVSFFSPSRDFTGSGTQNAFPDFPVPNGNFDSDNELFLLPNAGVSYRMDDDWVVGLSIYGNGGMNTEWGAMAHPFGGNGVYNAGSAGVDLTQVFFQPTYAREFFDGVSFGVGPIFAVQTFEAKGLSSFAGFSDDSANLTNNDHNVSHGFGGRFGVQVALSDDLRVGAAYQMRTFMSEFDKYAGLFAEQGDFDIPPAVQVGLSWKPTEDVVLMFDYRHIWYSDIAAVGNAGPRSSADMAARRLGPDSGVGFGWEDIDVFKFAAQWEIDDDWTVRAGYSLGENPIPSSEVLFNILAPGVIEHHFTVGLSHRVDERNAINVAGFYAPAASVSGPNPLNAGQHIELEMEQLEVAIGWSWQF